MQQGEYRMSFAAAADAKSRLAAECSQISLNR
jgi:hypothetical protein